MRGARLLVVKRKRRVDAARVLAALHHTEARTSYQVADLVTGVTDCRERKPWLWWDICGELDKSPRVRRVFAGQWLYLRGEL